MTTERRIGGGVFRLVQGDITTVVADAIVNAANEQLAHGGGVAGAIVRAGGDEIQRESDALAPVPTGGAVITTGGRLPARYVIHAVGPRGGMPDADRLLEYAVQAALRLAEENRLQSVAFPAISTGIFGYPLESCARIMTRVCTQWLWDAEYVQEITMVLFDGAALEAFEKALEEGAGTGPGAGQDGDVDWTEVRDPRQLPENTMAPSQIRRVRKLVDNKHRKGEGYREILLAFSGMDRILAADVLSRRADNEAFSSVRIRHHVLTVIWALFTIYTLATATSFRAVPVITANGAILFLLLIRSHWGYLFLVLDVLYYTGVAVTILSRFPLETALLASLILSPMGVLAIAAVSLHRRLFPYLRILDVRRDADRRPSILERAEPEMDR